MHAPCFVHSACAGSPRASSHAAPTSRWPDCAVAGAIGALPRRARPRRRSAATRSRRAAAGRRRCRTATPRTSTGPPPRGSASGRAGSRLTPTPAAAARLSMAHRSGACLAAREDVPAGCGSAAQLARGSLQRVASSPRPSTEGSFQQGRYGGAVAAGSPTRDAARLHRRRERSHLRSLGTPRIAQRDEFRSADRRPRSKAQMLSSPAPISSPTTRRAPSRTALPQP